MKKIIKILNKHVLILFLILKCRKIKIKNYSNMIINKKKLLIIDFNYDNRI